MKNLILLFFILSFSACCPKLTTTITSSSDTTNTFHSDTSTTLNIDTVHLPPIVIHDTVNMSNFCDSLAKGLRPQIHIKTNKGSVSIKADSVGHSEIECLTDSLIQLTKEQVTVITNLREEVVRNSIEKDTVKEPSIFKNTFFWLFILLIALVVYLAFKRR